MFTPNLIIGLTILAIGIVLMLDRLGITDAIALLTYWPVLLVLFGASVVAQAFRRTDPSVPPQRPVVAPGFVLLVVIIAMFASSNFGSTSVNVWGGDDRTAGDERITLFGVMGSTRQTSIATDFKGARVGSIMGRSTLDLRQATIPPGGEAVVEVFVAMGKATVIVPEGWTVDTSALPVMGRIDDNRWRGRSAGTEGTTPATGPPPRLRLRGFVTMGKVEIQS